MVLLFQPGLELELRMAGDKFGGFPWPWRVPPALDDLFLVENPSKKRG